MRKQCKRRQRPASPPMLVSRGMVNDRLEIQERMAVEAFANGFATKEHFETLEDMQGVLTFAGANEPSCVNAAYFCRDTIAPVMHSIKARHTKTGKFGVTAEELKVLRKFCGQFKDFWLRQSLALYEQSCNDLNRYYKMRYESAKQQHEATTRLPTAEQAA